MLSAVNVSKAYGSRILFDELNLTVAAGECIALIGANGSGKTTLLDILAGDISPDTGGRFQEAQRHYRLPQTGERWGFQQNIDRRCA